MARNFDFANAIGCKGATFQRATDFGDRTINLPRRSQLIVNGVPAASFWFGILVLSCPNAWAAGCNANKAGSIVGQACSISIADKARIEATAATMRKLEAEQPYKMEFSEDRLNVVVDRKGIVIMARRG